MKTQHHNWPLDLTSSRHRCPNESIPTLRHDLLACISHTYLVGSQSFRYGQHPSFQSHFFFFTFSPLPLFVLFCRIFQISHKQCLSVQLGSTVFEPTSHHFQSSTVSPLFLSECDGAYALCLCHDSVPVVSFASLSLVYFFPFSSTECPRASFPLATCDCCDYYCFVFLNAK